MYTSKYSFQVRILAPLFDYEICFGQVRFQKFTKGNWQLFLTFVYDHHAKPCRTLGKHPGQTAEHIFLCSKTFSITSIKR